MRCVWERRKSDEKNIEYHGEPAFHRGRFNSASAGLNHRRDGEFVRVQAGQRPASVHQLLLDVYKRQGPFTRKQTLAYLLIETVEGSLIYALIAVAYILMMMSSTVILTVPLVLSLILSSLLMFYFAFALFTWFYFLELVKPQAKWIKYGFLAVLLGFIDVYKRQASGRADAELFAVIRRPDPRTAGVVSRLHPRRQS